MAEKTGLTAFAAEAGAGEQLAEDLAASIGEQLDMLGLEAPEGIRRGRPPGRRNLRNQRIADYIIARHGDPLEQMAALLALPFDVMCKTFGISKADALAEKRLLAATVLPYLHQRQPIAVDMTNRNIVHLTINDGPVAPGAEPEQTTLTLDLAPIVLADDAG